MRKHDTIALGLGLLAGLAGPVGGCATTAAPPEAPHKRRAVASAPVPGEAFLRTGPRTVLADEVKLVLPLHLEGEVFLAANKTRRFEKDGCKVKEGVGWARLKFGEGIEIREANRILVLFPPACEKIRLVARGHVVLIDEAEKRVVRGATALAVNGRAVLFRGPYQMETLQ